MPEPEGEFTKLRSGWVQAMLTDETLKRESRNWQTAVSRYHYEYNFDWLGMPFIQLPQDVVALQEVIWRVKPDLIVETGVARGGSLVYTASLLALLDLIDSWGVEVAHAPTQRKVVGIEIDFREHNRKALDEHPLKRYIEVIEGSSVDSEILKQVARIVEGYSHPLVILDSNHTYAHVLAELNLYCVFVSTGSYLIVMDTGIEEAPSDLFRDKSWGIGNNPMTAVVQFLSDNKDFVADREVDAKLLVTASPGGYLRKIT